MKTGTAKGSKAAIVVNNKRIKGRYHKYAHRGIFSSTSGELFIMVEDHGRKWRPFDCPPIKDNGCDIKRGSKEGYARAKKTRELYAKGVPVSEICKKLGFRSRSSVHEIIEEKYYKTAVWEKKHA